tara:strand:+ start:3853 stop:4518 length:666 start_codon:yes stop_codon:yes gene_type:complete
MSKKQPSKEYIENLNYYKKMHLEGYDLIDGRRRKSDEAYDGKSTLVYAKLIKKIIEKNKIKSMLDYGCGKGIYYDNSFNSDGLKIKSLRSYWNIEIDLYDPCYEKNSFLDINKKFDLVICVDVLEHIPSCDIDWVLEKIVDKAKKYVFINIACHPAIALLPNKKNAHININPPQWWHQKILQFKKKRNEIKIICICSLKEKGEHKYFPLQYDDKLSNYATK